MKLFAALFTAAGLAAGQVNVLTYHNDLARTGQNLAEVLLTPNNVNAQQFGQLFTYPVDGYVYSQPLYMSGVRVAGKGLHNVVFVATEHDSVFAFDADSNAGANAVPLWQVSFLNAGATTVPAADTNCDQIVPEIGITGTPVIDPATGTLYVVAMTKEVSGASISYVGRLHALDVTSGAERPNSPVVIQATVPGSGEGGTAVTLAPRNYKQRPGLLLLNGNVYTSWSSHCDIGIYHGWIIAYDENTLQQTAVYNNTANGNMGSFWAGGVAPAADTAGNIYVVSGNGTFDANTGGSDLGESFIKLSTQNDLSVGDWFTPFNQQALNDADLDTGSCGALLLPDSVGSQAHPHLLTGSGKEGRIYLLDRDNMGRFQSGSDSQIVQSLPGAVGGVFGMPAYFNNTVYYSGSGDSLKAFSVQGTLSSKPVSNSPTSFGFPGSVPSISANGSANGIVWAVESGQKGTLHAYNAANLANEIYTSTQNAARDALGSYVKFSTPTIANGKVYVATQNSLALFGLLANAPATAGAPINAASFANEPVAPGSLVAIFGTGLAQSVQSATALPLPTDMGGTELFIDGMLAPLNYVSPSQINAQVPVEAGTGNATAAVSLNGQMSPSVPFSIQAAAPGLFTLGQNRAAVLNADGRVNSQSQPAISGSEISAYLTGQGPLNPPVDTGLPAPLSPLAQATLTVTASLGNQTAPVSFAGMSPGSAGLFQVNLQVPALASGEYSLTITVGGVTSNVAVVTVSAQ